MGGAHRSLGLLAGCGALAVDGGRGVAAAVVTLVVARVTAHGEWSPDTDNIAGGAWQRLAGGRGWAGHRRVTHWWVWPVLAWVAAGRASDPLAVALLLGVAAGWGSHVAGDFLVGAGSPWRGPGVPLLPAGWHVGFGFPAGGRVEGVLGVVLGWSCWVAVPVVLVRAAMGH